jgi:hypothetical protein
MWHSALMPTVCIGNSSAADLIFRIGYFQIRAKAMVTKTKPHAMQMVFKAKTLN